MRQDRASADKLLSGEEWNSILLRDELVSGSSGKNSIARLWEGEFAAFEPLQGEPNFKAAGRVAHNDLHMLANQHS